METKQITLRSKTVKCPYCGEYYSVTYKQCPFCDGKEREERRKARRERERSTKKKETGLLTTLFGSITEKTPAKKTQQKPGKKTEEAPEYKDQVKTEKRPERKKPTQEHKGQAKAEKKPERRKPRERKKHTAQREKTKVPVIPETEPQKKSGPVFDTMTVPDTFHFFDDFENEKPAAEEETTFAPIPISEEPPQVVLEPTQHLPRDIPAFVPETPPETPLSPDLSGSGEVPPEDPAEFSRWEFLQNFNTPEAGQEDGGETIDAGAEPAAEEESVTADSTPMEETPPAEMDLDTLLAEVKDMLENSPVPKPEEVQAQQTAAPQEPTAQPAEETQAVPEETQTTDWSQAVPEETQTTDWFQAVPEETQTTDWSQDVPEETQPADWTPPVEAPAQTEEEPTMVIPTAAVTAAAEAGEAFALSEVDSPFIEDASNPFLDPALEKIPTEETAAVPEAGESVTDQPEKPKAESYEDLFADRQSASEPAPQEEPARRERNHGKRKRFKADKRAKAESLEKKERCPAQKEQAKKSDEAEDLEPEDVWKLKKQHTPDEKGPHPTDQKKRNRGGRIVWIVLSLAVIVAAIFILVKYVKPMFQAGLFSGSQTQQEETAQGQGDFEDTAEHITLDQTDLSFTEAGATITLNPVFSPEGSQAHLTWTSSDTKVATVDGNGLVTTVAPGTTAVTASMANGQTAECTVRCNWNTGGESGSEANKPALNATDITLESKGKTQKLEVTGAAGTATWSSSKTDVATVASDGTVTAVEKGSTAITAQVDGQTLTCKVRCIW